MAGLLRPKSTSSVTYRHSKISIIKNTIAVEMLGGRMDGFLRPISKTSITSHFEITCTGVVVSCTIVGAFFSLYRYLCQEIPSMYFHWLGSSRSIHVRKRGLRLAQSMTVVIELHQGQGLNGVGYWTPSRARYQ